MDIKKILTFLRPLFFREWLVYFLIAVFIFIAVDIPGTIRAVQICQLNDLSGDLPMTKLYAFAKDRKEPSDEDWQRFKDYFRMILVIFPSQPVAELFLGLSEYYGYNHEEAALLHLKRSADNSPMFFWNLFDAGVLCFKKGDLDLSIAYLEKSLLIPFDGTVYMMAGSVLYRQFLLNGNETDLMFRLNRGRERALLLLTSAYLQKNNLEMAEVFVKKGVNNELVLNHEPFYFYAGLIAMKRSHYEEALSFFHKAIQVKTKNHLVYRYLADILKIKGLSGEAIKVSVQADLIEKAYPINEFPYPEYLRLEFF